MHIDGGIPHGGAPQQPVTYLESSVREGRGRKFVDHARDSRRQLGRLLFVAGHPLAVSIGQHPEQQQ